MGLGDRVSDSLVAGIARDEAGNLIVAGTVINGRYIVAVRLRNADKVSGYSAKVYTFFSDPSVKLYPGDIIVVDSGGDYNIARVINQEVSDNMASKTTKWVVNKVDTEAHEKRKQQEQRSQQLFRLMDEKVKAADKVSRYAMLAANDPQMAEMYEELRDLNTLLPPLPTDKQVTEK